VGAFKFVAGFQVVEVLDIKLEKFKFLSLMFGMA
jgi:hypothetical protein